MFNDKLDKAKQQFLSHKFSLQNLYHKKWIGISEKGDLIVHHSEQGLYEMIMNDIKNYTYYVTFLDDHNNESN